MTITPVTIEAKVSPITDTSCGVANRNPTPVSYTHLFGHVHEKYRTPFKGTWFFGLLTAFAGGFININVLFELVNIGTLSAFIIVSAGILWMRKTQPNAPRGFRAPGVPVTPILAIVFCFVLIAGLNWETWVRCV